MLITLLAACEPDTAIASTDTVSEDTGWAEYGDTDTDSDTDSDSDSDSDSDTDTGPKPEEPSPCQVALSATDPAYPVYPSWDGRDSVNLTVTLTGATKPWATVSWGGTNPDDWGWIACADVIGGSTAVIRVEAQGRYEASTFGNVDPGDGSTADPNGFWWYAWAVTGADLGGTSYEVQVDGETVNLVAQEEAPE